jgi:hypothetical protein
MPSDGYFVRDFLHYNWTKIEAENLRLKRQEAGSAGGKAQAEGVAGATALAGPSDPTSRPDPSHRTSPPETAADAGGGWDGVVPDDAGEDDIPT